MPETCTIGFVKPFLTYHRSKVPETPADAHSMGFMSPSAAHRLTPGFGSITRIPSRANGSESATLLSESTRIRALVEGRRVGSIAHVLVLLPYTRGWFSTTGFAVSKLLVPSCE